MILATVLILWLTTSLAIGSGEEVTVAPMTGVPLTFYVSAFFCATAWLVLHVALWFLATHPPTGMGYSHLWRAFISRYLEWASIRTRVSAQGLRSVFTATPTVRNKPARDHTHPNSAEDRSSASATIDLFGSSVGYTPYYVQRSRSDERHLREGSRAYYWAKDLQTTPVPFKTSEEHLLAFVDVDQYVDMPYLLTHEFKPCLIYTFQPTECAAILPEYSFTFDGEGTTDYRVSGGARYTHGVWNYATDNLLAIKYGLFGIPTETAAFLVDRRATSPHHELILVTPVRKWTGLSAIVAAILQGNHLERLRFAFGDFLRLRVQRADGVVMSTSRVGSYSCANVGIRTDEAIAAVARTSKLDLTLPQVIKQVSDTKEKLETSAAMVLLEYHRLASTDKPPFVYPIEQSVKHYAFVVNNDPGDTKPSVVPFMPPIMDGCFSPMQSEENERRAIASRITQLKKLDVKMTPFLMQTVTEFNEKLIPTPHQLHPASLDEVYIRQNRPAQRRLLVEGETTNSSRIVKSFLKKETYEIPNDPRVITTINPHDKLEYSTITYSLSELYTALPCYAFAKTPLEIANHLAAGASRAQSAALGDFSRMDGHCNEIDRTVNQITAMRAFSPQHHDKVLETMSTQHNVTGYGTYGTKYQSGDERLSGSPETAIFNSDITARVVFTGFRMMKNPVTGTFYNRDEAWDMLNRSMVGGDDSAVFDICSATFIKAAALYGQILEVDTIARGGKGFNFLSRFYTDRIWFGENASTCDLQRQARKFHVTTHLPVTVTPVMKLVEKCRSFYMSDKVTPVLGPLCVYVCLKAVLKNMPKTDALGIFRLSDEESQQYPNDITDADAVDELERSRMHPDSDAKMRAYLATNPTLEDIVKTMPLLVEPSVESIKLKGSVVIGDELHVKEPEANTTDSCSTDGAVPPTLAPNKPAGRGTIGGFPAHTATVAPKGRGGARKDAPKGKTLRHNQRAPHGGAAQPKASAPPGK